MTDVRMISAGCCCDLICWRLILLQISMWLPVSNVAVVAVVASW
jgi:hypothetical protein